MSHLQMYEQLKNKQNPKNHYTVLAFQDSDFKKLLNQLLRHEKQRLRMVQLNKEKKLKALAEGKVIPSRNRHSKPLSFHVLGEYYEEKEEEEEEDDE